MKNIEEAQERLSKGKYLDWCNAGGPNECAHGYADGIPCRRCDEALASRLPTPVEPKAQVESASVGAISDHEKGQKEEFYKFQQHLEKTQEEISKWPSWMREAGRASMGLDQREPAKVEAGEGLMDLTDYESMYANAVGELKAEQEAHQASLLREKELRELLREVKGYMSGAGWQKLGQRIKAAVKGE